MTLKRVPIGELAEFINGAAFKPADWEGDGARIIRIQNLTDHSKPFNRTNRSVADKLRVRPGDLLVSWSATLGVFEWTGPDEGLLNQHIFRVLPDRSRVHKSYLRHMLHGALDDVERHLHGATMKHVNRGEFLATLMPVPPLNEQRRIAAILDQADALRAKRRAALAHLDDFTQSIFLDMFGDPDSQARWPVVPLGDVVTDLQGGKSLVAPDSAGPSVNRVLKISAVTQMHFRPDECKAVPDDYLPRRDHFVRQGDLLFSRANTTELVGALAYVWDTPPNLLLPDKLWRFVWTRPEEVEPLFIWALFQTQAIRRELSARSSGTGGSMKNISKTKLLPMQIPLPPCELQERFRAVVTAQEQLKATLRTQSSELDALFTSLRARAFAGELLHGAAYAGQGIS